MKKILISVGTLALPAVAFAQATLQTIPELVTRLAQIINVIIPFIVGLAVLIIIWGVLTYITAAGDEEKRKESKTYIVWGIVGVFIMVSIWGLVNILVRTFPTEGGTLKSEVLRRTEIPIGRERVPVSE